MAILKNISRQPIPISVSGFSAVLSVGEEKALEEGVVSSTVVQKLIEKKMLLLVPQKQVKALTPQRTPQPESSSSEGEVVGNSDSSESSKSVRGRKKEPKE